MPSPLKIRNRDEVVPQSMLPINHLSFFSESVSETPRGKCSSCVTVGGDAFSTCIDLAAASVGRFNISKQLLDGMRMGIESIADDVGL